MEAIWTALGKVTGFTVSELEFGFNVDTLICGISIGDDLMVFVGASISSSVVFSPPECFDRLDSEWFICVVNVVGLITSGITLAAESERECGLEPEADCGTDSKFVLEFLVVGGSDGRLLTSGKSLLEYSINTSTTACDRAYSSGFKS